MLSTYRWNGTVIVLRPANPRVFKFRFTWTAFAILGLSGLISFCLMVAVGYTFPPLVTDREHMRLQNENLELRLRNKNAGFGVAKVEDRIARLEQESRRIVELTQVD